jgi:hypothetical protein
MTFWGNALGIRLLLPLSLALSVSLVGCQGSDIGAGGDETIEPAQSCLDDSICDSGFVCEDGVCVSEGIATSADADEGITPTQGRSVRWG